MWMRSIMHRFKDDHLNKLSGYWNQRTLLLTMMYWRYTTWQSLRKLMAQNGCANLRDAAICHICSFVGTNEYEEKSYLNVGQFSWEES